MDTISISISQLKINPAKAISQADDYPMLIESRGKGKAYLVGKNLFEVLMSCLEDYEDRKAVKETNFKEGKNFEKVAKELNI